MNAPGVHARTYVPQDKLYLWALVNPSRPVLVGELQLSQLLSDCATFVYSPGWWNFPLSEDLPIIEGQLFSAGVRSSAPGAIDDARPDRWGERIIRHVDRPARLSILEMLLFAGDDRFGALGVSLSADQYLPRYLGPHPLVSDLAALARAIEDVQSQAPLTPEIQRLILPGVSLGGARPKALLQTDDGPCVIKFSELDDPVDTPLIEHATMTLAKAAGINVATTGVHRLPKRHGRARHALTIARFDRVSEYRLHCLSAKTVLSAAGLPESYGALATTLLRLGHPDQQSTMREELFKRMVFNILMDNTDDHEKNHSLLRQPDGAWLLSPAYDVVPTAQGLGWQAMQVGDAGAEATLDNALSQVRAFNLRPAAAREIVTQIARQVDGWRAHFVGMNVRQVDIATLAQYLDGDQLGGQRRRFLTGQRGDKRPPNA